VRLLVVEDNKDLNRQIATALSQAGYAVDRAFDGEEGWFLGDTEPYDAVVLDLGLPKKDGISILSEWRRAGRSMPVLILTARDRWSDKVRGFDAGADDCRQAIPHRRDSRTVAGAFAPRSGPRHERVHLRSGTS
jgi:two-component system, OmpR family, response regulator